MASFQFRQWRETYSSFALIPFVPLATTRILPIQWPEPVFYSPLKQLQIQLEEDVLFYRSTITKDLWGSFSHS